MHFGAGFFGCEHPVDAGAFGISSFLPGGGFGDEPGVAVDASIETLAGQDADLDLDHVEPACVGALHRRERPQVTAARAAYLRNECLLRWSEVLGDVMELQAAQNASRFIGRECLVERAGRMR